MYSKNLGVKLFQYAGGNFEYMYCTVQHALWLK